MKNQLVINGIKIIPAEYMDNMLIVKRSWRERLFERPWKPLASRKATVSHKFYVYSNNEVFVSYYTFGILAKGLKLEGAYFHGPSLAVDIVKDNLNGVISC